MSPRKSGALAAVAADPAPVPIDTADVRRRFKENRAALAGYFSDERAPIFRALDACVLSKHHAFLGGPAGLAKSLVVETWAQAFKGATYRRELLTRQTTETDLLCYLDVPEFAKGGKYVYRYDGKIVEAEIVFVDECFKGMGVLNALLTWLNERTVRGGYQSPLVTAIGASNEMGEDDSVAALEDRFLARFWISPLTYAARLDYLRGRAAGARPPSLTPITLAELAACQAEVAVLPVDESVLLALASLVDALSGVGIYVSDRRIGWCVEILRAVAWLDGAAEVDVDHVEFLKDVLWRRPEDKPSVDAAIAAVDKGIVGEVRRLVETAMAPWHQATSLSTPEELSRVAPEHMVRMQDAGNEIRERFRGKAPDRLVPRIRAYLEELATAHAAAAAAAKRI